MLERVYFVKIIILQINKHFVFIILSVPFEKFIFFSAGMTRVITILLPARVCTCITPLHLIGVCRKYLRPGFYR